MSPRDLSPGSLAPRAVGGCRPLPFQPGEVRGRLPLASASGRQELWGNHPELCIPSHPQPGLPHAALLLPPPQARSPAVRSTFCLLGPPQPPTHRNCDTFVPRPALWRAARAAGSPEGRSCAPGHLWARKLRTGLCEFFWRGADNFHPFSKGPWPLGWVTVPAPLPASQYPHRAALSVKCLGIKGINSFSVLWREGVSSPLGDSFREAGSGQARSLGSGPSMPHGFSHVGKWGHYA